MKKKATGVLGYSMDLRIRVMEAYDQGIPVGTICEMFQICMATIYNWLKRRALTGCLAVKQGFKSGRPLQINRAAIRKMLLQNPSLKQMQIAQKLGISIGAVCKIIESLGFTRKKNNTYMLKGIST
jgi:transposase